MNVVRRTPIVDDRVHSLSTVARSSIFCEHIAMEDIERHFAKCRENSTGNGLEFRRRHSHIKRGIHRTYASSIERGRVQVSIAIASQLAEALEIPLSKLFRDVERFAKGELSNESSEK